jgi:PAS domain S-box-containing protein
VINGDVIPFLETEEPSLDQFPLPVEHITSSSTSSFKLPVHILLSFMEKVPDFIYVLSLRGLFLYVSPESCKNLLEWESTDLLGHKINEFVHPSDLVAVMRDLRNCSSEGNVNFICRMKRKNSGYTYMEMNGHVSLYIFESHFT